MDWQLKFPKKMAATTMRPHIVLVFKTTKQVVLLELTVSWKDHSEEAFKRKLSKYVELVSNSQKAG